ncbi:hypothetical protein [Nocardioides pyridinolyticus]
MARERSRRRLRELLHADTSRRRVDPAFTDRLAAEAGSSPAPVRRPRRRAALVAALVVLLLLAAAVGLASATGASWTPWSPDHPAPTPTPTRTPTPTPTAKPNPTQPTDTPQEPGTPASPTNPTSSTTSQPSAPPTSTPESLLPSVDVSLGATVSLPSAP